MENKQTKAQWRFDEIMWWKPRITKPMENKQTAVEWLFKQLWEEPKDKMVWYAILDKAKAMEKEQIIAAIDNFQTNQWGEFLNGEEYYQETYKK